MAKKKTARKKVAPKKRSAPKKRVELEKAPEYMIQISDPKMLRKDILESLREVIIFMQGYEKFRKIQEEKVALFSALKTSVRELNALIDSKLKSYLPKGKLKVLAEMKKPQNMIDAEKVEVVNVKRIEAVPVMEEMDEEEVKPKNDLAELEGQLNDIEDALKKIS
jgi:hypothetical protein